MSESKEEKKTVGSALKDMFAGGFGATVEDVLDMVANPDDKALPHLTEINQPVEMSTLDTLTGACNRSSDEEVREAGVVLGDFGYYFRVNMKSHKRKGVREIIGGIVSVIQMRWQLPVSTSEKLFGERR